MTGQTAVTQYIGALPNAVDPGFHCCKAIADENRIRNLMGERSVFVFRDFDLEAKSNGFYLKSNTEFVRIAFCPFCGEKLWA